MRTPDACIVTEYFDLTRAAKRKGWILEIDEYQARFIVKDENNKYELVGACDTIEELAYIVLL